jgi:hypothetical protein
MSLQLPESIVDKPFSINRETYQIHFAIDSYVLCQKVFDSFPFYCCIDISNETLIMWKYFFDKPVQFKISVAKIKTLIHDYNTIHSN